MTEPEIVRYFETELKPALQARGLVLTDKDLTEKRADIEKVLVNEKINAATDAYLEEARTRADIVILNR